MIRKTLQLSCPEDYSLKTLCLTHGWRQLQPFSWDGEAQALDYVFHTGRQPVDLRVTQEGAILLAEVSSAEALDTDELGTVERALASMLALNRDTEVIGRLAAATSGDYVSLVTSGVGRILIAPTAWENAAKTLFTTNCSWALTRKMAEKICSEAFTTPAPSGRFPFPSPSEVNRFSADELKGLISAGYRASYLKALAQYFVDHSEFEEALINGDLNHAEATRKITALKGFGEYARIHLMTLMGFYGEIPVDSVVRSYMKSVHGVEDVSPFLETQYGDWGAHRWWKFKMESMLKERNWP